MSDQRGRPLEALKKKYVQLAKGGAGAIITGYAGIHRNGKSPLYRMLMIDNDSLIDSYRELVDAVHAHDTPIILQIAHCGRQTRSKITGHQPVAPSAIRDKFYNEDMPRELSDSDIEDLIDRFVKSVWRGKKAGFDGVQLHGAHGYLLSQFLSPHMNRRTDKWGGNTENRFRIVHEILMRARQKVGDFPILIKINGHEGRKKGLRVEEAVVIAKLLEQSGCSGIEVSCGVVEDGFYTIRGEQVPMEAVLAYTFRYKRLPGLVKSMIRPFGNKLSPRIDPLTLYNVPASQAVKEAVSLPVIVVGGIKSLDDITGILESNQADFVSMSRPFIIEPNIVNKFKSGRQTRSKCIACNFCCIVQEEKPLRCYHGKLRKAPGGN
jgi:2,4-dienoyl-CoA reductase-like NADH-dependent reductase (Old Yellow Enzyme family)